jgi:outer membrane protein OmpA-like peptidoglycan-associated protein
MRFAAFLFLILLTFSAEAQKKDPMVFHSENEKADNLFREAIEFQRIRRFDLAMKNLEAAIKKDEKFEEAYSMLVKNYELFFYQDKLKKLYPEILRHLPESNLAGKVYLAYAEASFDEGKMPEAKIDAEKSIRLNSKDLAIKTKAMQILRNADFVMAESQEKVEPLNMQPLSEEVDRFPLQYFPAMTADENFIIFTARKGNHASFDENIYVSRKVNGHWLVPQGISNLINTSENEGTSSINADGRVLVFTRCGSPEGQGSCDLFITEREGNVWKQPRPLREVNSPYWDSHPSLSADGRRIFFTSARPGGQGRMDIWCAEKDSNEVWQTPYNLGQEINTPFDEETPFIHANGQTLYFASDGHPGFGKIDLFATSPAGNGWRKPKNLGRAINGNGNESGLFITASGKTGMFCIEDRRDRDLISSQIRFFKVPPGMQSGPACTFLSGLVTDAVTGKKLAARVELVNQKTGKTEFSMDSDKDLGTYTAVLSLGQSYGLYVSKAGYLFSSNTIRTDSLPEGSEGMKKDVPLEPIRSGASIVLNNLFFESGKADLLLASLPELRKIGRLMSLNPAMKIEVSGHTDNVGKDPDNLILSQKRANAVRDHLVKQGIPASRIVPKGYGETKPLNDNSDEDKRRLNRRIEFRVM